MKKIFLILTATISVNICFSQIGNSPYPVIFVHGLNSDNNTWNTVITQLSSSWSLSNNHTLNFVLNARGGDTTNYIDDVLFPLKDGSGSIVNSIANSSIFSVNFGNFWNRNASDPRIILYSNSTPGSNQSPSNQSSIYKEGYALKILIDSVLRVTGADRVILVGHSMGGLAIREYLQRAENGIHKWWIDPNDPVNGHRVARVVTTGTPHLGTNVLSNAFFTIDNNSEAMRDMKYSYPSGDNASYMFGNPEAFVPSSYYNKDINCNGVITDTITGIDSNTKDNSSMPLPTNILYTYITGNYLGLGTDGAVPLSRQSLYVNSNAAPVGLADTILTNKNHIQETGDVRALIRGLDEPNKKDFAYDVSFGKLYAGFITLRPYALTSDTDYYKVKGLSGGKFSVNIQPQNSGATSIALLTSSGSVIVSKNITASSDSISFYGQQSDYFLRVTGNSNQNPNLNSYKFTPDFIPAAILSSTIGIEGMWNGSVQMQDTLKLYLRNNIPPYNSIDSAIVFLNSSGNSAAEFIHASAGNYYISVDHRNGLDTWSSFPLAFSNGVTTNYDFTFAQSQAYGNNQMFKSGRWCIYSGDVNNDRVIDGSDAVLIDNDAFQFASGYLNTDLTGDNFIDATDAAIADNNMFNFISAISP